MRLWAIFYGLHSAPNRGGSSCWSSQTCVQGSTCDMPGIIPWNTLPRLGIEPGPRRGQTMRYIHSPTELS